MTGYVLPNMERSVVCVVVTFGLFLVFSSYGLCHVLAMFIVVVFLLGKPFNKFHSGICGLLGIALTLLVV